jgi:hypothetical protein
MDAVRLKVPGIGSIANRRERGIGRIEGFAGATVNRLGLTPHQRALPGDFRGVIGAILAADRLMNA